MESITGDLLGPAEVQAQPIPVIDKAIGKTRMMPPQSAAGRRRRRKSG